MGLLNLKVCQVTCIVAILASITAIVSIIVGFVIMGTFYATYAHTSVGIWCGLLMFLHICTGVLMLGTRTYAAGISYVLVNVVCLAFMVYGTIVAYDYFESFSDFRKYNEKGSCVVRMDKCVCSDGIGERVFRKGYAVPTCPLYSFGEDLWMTMLVLMIINAVWSFAGLIIGLTALGTILAKTQEDKLTERASSYNKRGNFMCN